MPITRSSTKMKRTSNGMEKQTDQKRNNRGAGAAGPHEKEQSQPETTVAGSSGQEFTALSEEAAAEIARERDEYLDSLKRLQAEFANFRKRIARESEQAGHRAASEVIEDLLPVLDNFERAMKAAAGHDQAVLTEGVELVYNQLRSVLVKRGLCEIEAHGQAFDPNQHEAVLCQPSSGHEEGTVLEVLEKGYQLGDKVVRPARVIVSKEEEKD